MAKWVRSTTMKSWNVRGKVIPASSSSDWLKLLDSEFVELEKSPTFKAYVKSGEVIVVDKEPQNTNANVLNQMGKLREENRKLSQELDDLKKKNKNLSNFTPRQDDSAQELEEAKKALETAKEELETAKRQIAGLKGQITKLTKGEASE